MVYELGTLVICGLRMEQPDIPPLSIVGGVRCSVKPASRYTLHFRDHETQTLV